MYKKSLILFFTIACFNTSFGESNSADFKANFSPESAIENELFNKLKDIDPAQAALYLTLQQELNQNNKHEKECLSKPGMCLGAAGIAAGLALVGLSISDTEIAKNFQSFCLAGFLASIIGIVITDRAVTPYSDKNTKILEEIKNINLTLKKDNS